MVARMRDRGGGDLNEAELAERSASTKLGLSDLKSLLAEAGVVLRTNQARALLDCLDREKKGTIRLQDLMEVTGMERPSLASAGARTLRGHCVWETVCQETGMRDAFRISVAPAAATGPGVAVLGNGEKRHCVELRERRERLDVLKAMGERRPTATKSRNDRCDAINVSQAEQRKSLAKLRELSREKRDEQRLRELLRSGTPPPGPELRVAPPDDPAVRHTPLSDRLLLCWHAPPLSQVAFFSLEIGHTSGQGREQIFTEIFR